MKNFKSFLKESGINNQGPQAMDIRTTNMGVLSNPAVVKKLNAWVGTIAGNYALPEEAINNLRTSLSKIESVGIFDIFLRISVLLGVSNSPNGVPPR